MSEVPRHMRSHCELIKEIEEQEKEIAELVASVQRGYEWTASALNDKEKEIEELKEEAYIYQPRKWEEKNKQLAEARELIEFYSKAHSKGKASKYLEKYPSEDR